VPPTYDGPIIDTHHHLWDLSAAAHPWLFSAADGVRSLGDFTPLQRDFTVEDYVVDTAGAGVVASVHVEAHWDRGRSPVEETRWLETLDKSRRVAERYIAFAPLASPDVESVLAEQAAFPRVVALRETIRWHPDPAKSWAPPGVVEDPQWRRGLGLLKRHDLALDLMMGPHQADEIARLARAFPEQIFIVNHCGTPIDRDAEGMAFWRKGVATMGREPNVSMKVSNFLAFAPDLELETLRPVVMHCIESFGPERCMFGSNYPLSQRLMSFPEQCALLKRIVAALSPEEQRALFHDTAARHYRFAQSTAPRT
jgi:predicted TIM-barrel fold metal-dependent hydrolase